MAGDVENIWQHTLSFNGKNYDTWEKEMKTMMIANDLWVFVVNGFNDVTNLA